MQLKTWGFAGALMAMAGSAYAQAPTDAQIAAIVVTANQVDIDAGKLAESNGSDSHVKAFGKQMASDHMGVNKQAVDLVKRRSMSLIIASRMKAATVRA